MNNKQALLSFVCLLICGFTLLTVTSIVTGAPTERTDFTGEWVVSFYTEKGVQTNQYDGTVITIRKDGDVFTMDGPTENESVTKYRVSGNKLAGAYMVSDLEAAKRRWPQVQDNVLLEAIASRTLVYRSSFTMKPGGEIVAELDGVQLFWNSKTNHFSHAQRYPGFIKYTLARKN